MFVIVINGKKLSRDKQDGYDSYVKVRSANKSFIASLEIGPTTTMLVMAALCPVISIFLLLLLLFPRLISAVRDWMSTILPHMVWP